MTDPKTPRRRSLLKGAAVAAGAMSAPMVMAQTPAASFRFQSTWPAKDIFHEYANDFAKKVNDMAGGKLKIEVLPAGAVVQGLPAAGRGEQGHAGRRPRRGGLPLRQEFGPGPVGFGPGLRHGPNMVLAWHNYGGGKALLDEIYKSSTWTWCLTCTAPCPRSRWAGSRSRSPTSGHQGPEVPHRGPGRRRVHRHGRGGQPAARRRDRAGAGPRPDRRGRVQQRVVRPRAGLPRRGQELHAAKLPPERRAVRDPVQQGQVRRPAGRAEGHHRLRRAGRQSPT
jgi:hypothetical protein